MSSVLPPSTAGQALSLAALGCSSTIASEQPLSESHLLIADGTSAASDAVPPAPNAACVLSNASVTVESASPSPPAPHVLPVTPASLPTAPKAKHRIAEVREQQGVSQRTLARRLGIDVKSLQALEQPDCDLSLSQLLAFQVALDVPLIDLLEECPALSRPIAERAKMVKVMKTAVALREIKLNRRVERMAEMLCEQLIDVMPELAEVSGWPQFGSRRGTSALGRALSQPIDTSNLGLPD